MTKKATMKLKPQSTLEQVRAAVCQSLGLNKSALRDDAHFANDLGADSIDLGEIFTNLEEAFDISITDEEAALCCTVQHATRLVELKLRPEEGTRWYIVYLDNDPSVLGLVELKINSVPLDHKPYGNRGDEIDHLHTVPNKSHLKRASYQAFPKMEDAAEYGAQLARTHSKSFYLFDTQFRILDN
jgi:acyl carrier protein